MVTPLPLLLRRQQASRQLNSSTTEPPAMNALYLWNHLQLTAQHTFGPHVREHPSELNARGRRRCTPGVFTQHQRDKTQQKKLLNKFRIRNNIPYYMHEAYSSARAHAMRNFAHSASA